MRATVLSLSLLVFRVFADDPHHATALDHLALLTNFFDAGSDFHRTAQSDT